MFTVLFWKDTFERTVKTFAETLASLLLAGPALSVINVDWIDSIGVAALAAVVAVLTSIGSATVTSNAPTISPASVAKDNRGI